MTTIPSTGQVRLLGWDDLKARGITVSKPTIYRQMKSGKFPKPVYPGKSPAWIESEIDAYLRSLAADRACHDGVQSAQ